MEAYSKRRRAITLQIIVKSHMFGDFCYLGYHRGSDRVFRPLLVKSKELDIGGVYVFFYKNSDQMNFLLPHAMNDLFAEQVREVKIPIPNMWASTVECLYDFASPTFFDGMLRHETSITDSYGNMKEVTKFYVHEGTQCHSVGVLLPHILNIYESKEGKYRIELTLDDVEEEIEVDHTGKVKYSAKPMLYDFPYTASETPHHTLLDSPNYDKLVMLSMCRPFAGKGSEPFYPRRCYILVVGILIRPRPAVEDFW